MASYQKMAGSNTLLLQISLMALLFIVTLTQSRKVENWLNTIHKEATSYEAKFKFPQEWSEWKLKHGRSYESSLEELERHLIWLSNKQYIDHHNVNSRIFGFTLAMNHLGDVVIMISIVISLRG